MAKSPSFDTHDLWAPAKMMALRRGKELGSCRITVQVLQTAVSGLCSLRHMNNVILHSAHVLCARGGRRSVLLQTQNSPGRRIRPCRATCTDQIPRHEYTVRFFFGDIPIASRIFYTTSSSCKKIWGDARNIQRLRYSLIAFCGNTLYLVVQAFHP
jgi:hypothetical protein